MVIVGKAPVSHMTGLLFAFVAPVHVVVSYARLLVSTTCTPIIGSPDVAVSIAIRASTLSIPEAAVPAQSRVSHVPADSVVIPIRITRYRMWKCFGKNRYW